MPDSLSRSPSQAQIEELVGSLTGIASARAVVTSDGRVIELHVLATTSLHPKQVVRNVESALNAGLGVEVDRRVISVAQVEGAERPRGGQSGEESVSGDEPEVDIGRFVFMGFEATRPGSRRARCAVTLGLGDDRFHGAGEGPDTLQGRAEAAARAVVQAVANASGEDLIGLEGARVIETDGRRYVVVAAHLVNRRPALELSGAAVLDRSPEEAAILATLQATNRWSRTQER